MIIRNNWSPKHIPSEIFCKQYEWFFDERRKTSKKDPINYVFKILLNSVYGLSNDKNSFLYDSSLTLAVTINGQLLLSQLVEELCESIPNCKPIMLNTDGFELKFSRKYLPLYYQICEKWEKLTKLNLEYDEYEKMIIGDVNNYLSINKIKEVSKENWLSLQEDEPYYIYTEKEGKYYYNAVKTKGRFEFHNLALHKNKSYLVIKKALYNYFIFNKPIEDTIKENKNIFDFCAGVKIKGDWTFYEHKVIKGKYTKEKLQKTLRYYVSKSGSKIIKENNTDGRQIQLESGPWLLTTFMKATLKENFNEYEIDYKYYIDNANKELANFYQNSNQLTIF